MRHEVERICVFIVGFRHNLRKNQNRKGEMFKQKCNEFLDAMTSLRTKAINDAVNQALATEHAIYVDELNDAKNNYIAEETRKHQALVRQLQEEFEAKKIACMNETANAIKIHKEKVTANAEEKAKANYDNFILGVAQLVDSTHIN